MIDIITMVAVFFTGLVMGTFFFGGLLWTIGHGLLVEHPAIWFLSSTLVRFGIVLVAFYFVSAGRWERIVVCAAGFFISRILLIRFARTVAEPGSSKQEAGDAT